MGGSGIVSTAFYPLSFQGNNTFINNRGASLSVSTCVHVDSRRELVVPHKQCMYGIS